jgi:Ca2+/Na+ antiporter
LYTNAVTGDGMYSVIFILVAFLTTFFSKNMISVLCVGVVVSNILKYGKEISIQEGFEDKEEKISDEDGELEVDTLEKDVDKKDTDKSKNMKKNVKKEHEEEYERLLKYQNQLLEGVSKMAPVLKSAQESLAKITKISETK